MLKEKQQLNDAKRKQRTEQENLKRLEESLNSLQQKMEKIEQGRQNCQSRIKEVCIITI